MLYTQWISCLHHRRQRESYCGEVRVNAGRSVRDEPVAARASGLKVRDREAMVSVYVYESNGGYKGMGKTMRGVEYL